MAGALISYKITEDPQKPQNQLLVHTLTHDACVKHVAFSPDNQTLVFVHGDFLIKLWDVSGHTPKEKGTLTGHSSPVLCVAFSSDNKTLASGSFDRTVKLWDVETQECKGTLTGHLCTVKSVAFSHDNKTLAAASFSDKTVKLWDVSGDTPKEKGTLRGHSQDNPECTCTHPQFRYNFYDYTANPLCPVRGHSGPVLCVAFSPDNKTLASGSFDDTVKLWDVETQECMGTLTGHLCTVWSVAFSPDNKTLASASEDKTVRLWDVSGDTPKEKGTIEGHTQGNQDCTCYHDYYYRPNPACPVTGHSDGVNSVAFTPDNKTLASASSDKTIKLWDVSGVSVTPFTHPPPHTLKGHSDCVNSVAFSHDSKTLASASRDKTVKLWNRISKSQSEHIDLRLDEAKKLAFCMVTHPRLGEATIYSNDLSPEMLRMTLDLEYIDW